MERDDSSIATIKRLDAAWFVLTQLEQAGYKAYLAGGCVRDMVLGQSPADYDIATNALPEAVQDLFETTVPTGIQHGTVSVIVNEERIEVTTFRKEAQYVAARRPASVEFVDDLQIDLSRRDFTINAMAMDRQGKLYDPFQGMQDLQQRVIRAVGNPDLRLQEDALRILRAIRFATRLQAAIDLATWDAMCRYANEMTSISRERIRDEWDKIILSDLRTGMTFLLQAGLIEQIFPKSVQVDSTACKQAAIFANMLSKHLNIRYAGLFLSLKLDEGQISQILRYLRQPRHLINSVQSILQAIPLTDPVTWEDSTWSNYLFDHGKDAAYRALQIYGRLQARRLQAKDYEQQLIAKFNQASEKQPIWSLQDLAVTGQDLMDHCQLSNGPQIGHLLRQLAAFVLANPDLNAREQLLVQATEQVQSR